MHLLIVLSLTLLIQCKPSSPEEVQVNERHKEIMVIHDDVMPKMKDIYQLKKSLKTLPADSTTTSLIDDLDAADEAMMEWMHQYKKPKSITPEVWDYLDGQEKAIAIVRDQMLLSISNAKKYLEE